MKKFSFLKVINSPFKPFKLKWYCGKVAIGTPYFFPRRWVDNPDKPGYMVAVPKKIGFDFVDLGWKTKWSATDYRFEWAPLISFVFFKWQIAVMFIAPEQDHYWEAWLYYENNTDKNKSKAERISQCRTEFPLYVTIHNGQEKESVDYYNKILKTNYL
jgi:hypothetical protein